MKSTVPEWMKPTPRLAEEWRLKIGYRIFRSGGARQNFPSPGLANVLSPSKQAAGVVGKAAAMPWFVVKGVSARAWKVPASAVGGWR